MREIDLNTDWIERAGDAEERLRYHYKQLLAARTKLNELDSPARGSLVFAAQGDDGDFDLNFRGLHLAVRFSLCLDEPRQELMGMVQWTRIDPLQGIDAAPAGSFHFGVDGKTTLNTKARQVELNEWFAPRLIVWMIRQAMPKRPAATANA